MNGYSRNESCAPEDFSRKGKKNYISNLVRVEFIYKVQKVLPFLHNIFLDAGLYAADIVNTFLFCAFFHRTCSPYYMYILFVDVCGSVMYALQSGIVSVPIRIHHN